MNTETMTAEQEKMEKRIINLINDYDKAEYSTLFISLKQYEKTEFSIFQSALSNLLSLGKIELIDNYVRINPTFKKEYSDSDRMTAEQVLEMEILHNVYIDGMMFTHGKRDDIYGWRPIPAEWYNRQDKSPTTNQKGLRK